MNPNSLWVIVGISTGVAAGILGSFMGWMRSRGEHAKAVNSATAALTLLLAVAAGLVVLRVKIQWEYRVWLLLAPVFLTHWFVSQVRMIRSGRCHGQCRSGDEV